MLGKKLVLEKRYVEKKDLQFLDRKDMWAWHKDQNLIQLLLVFSQITWLLQFRPSSSNTHRNKTLFLRDKYNIDMKMVP